jgi:hypothetical protein
VRNLFGNGVKYLMGAQNFGKSNHDVLIPIIAENLLKRVSELH